MPFLVPRVTILLAARTAGLLGAIDTPNGNIHDLTQLASEAATAASLGFRGKFALHAKQLDVIASAFEPRDEEVALARQIVQVFGSGVGSGKASMMVGELFVDYAIALRARRLSAGSTEPRRWGRFPVAFRGD